MCSPFREVGFLVDGFECVVRKRVNDAIDNIKRGRTKTETECPQVKVRKLEKSREETETERLFHLESMVAKTKGIVG